jgi:N-acetylglutamate synthase-like GNAT family acetyltransferase
MSTPARRVSQLDIRLAGADDAPVIAEVLLKAFSMFRKHYTADAFAAVTPSAEEIKKRFDEGPMWVATLDRQIVGTVSVVAEPEWLYIRSMAVGPTALRLGIGSRLLAAVEKYARGEGFEKLFLYTTYFSAGAVELYEKNGFTRGRDTSAEEWFGTPGLEMWKDLK